ncbi:MAG: hypothetical protein HQ518_20050 [Rhodopirellula sp.]|nr:hypothetical protein [Rhodopirellula sp.]
MNRFLWTVLRVSLSAWVGAAILFVITGVREVTMTDFDAATKNMLAATRFPAYYAFGFTLVIVAAISTVGLILIDRIARRRKVVILTLAILSLVVMFLDHRFIYLPLEAMMLEPEGRLQPDFFTYHQWSKYINCVSVGASLIASFVAACPLPTLAFGESSSES